MKYIAMHGNMVYGRETMKTLAYAVALECGGKADGCLGWASTEAGANEMAEMERAQLTDDCKVVIVPAIDVTKFPENVTRGLMWR